MVGQTLMAMAVTQCVSQARFRNVIVAVLALIITVSVAFAVEFVFFQLSMQLPKQSLCHTVNDDCTPQRYNGIILSAPPKKLCFFFVYP